MTHRNISNILSEGETYYCLALAFHKTVLKELQERMVSKMSKIEKLMRILEKEHQKEAVDDLIELNNHMDRFIAKHNWLKAGDK